MREVQLPIAQFLRNYGMSRIGPRLVAGFRGRAGPFAEQCYVTSSVVGLVKLRHRGPVWAVTAAGRTRGS